MNILSLVHRKHKEPSPFTKVGKIIHNRHIAATQLRSWRDKGYHAKVTTVTCKEGEGYILWVDLNKKGMMV
jgi:hypothetical protein